MPDRSVDSPRRSLAEVRDALLALPDPFRRAEVQAAVQDLRPRMVDLDRYLNFSDQGYTRTLFYRGPRFEILVLCWKDGQASPIHDHSASICSMVVVKGTCKSINFREINPGSPVKEGETVLVPIEPANSCNYEAGKITTVVGGDIHQIANLQGDGSDLVTVHFYLPPIVTMRCFDQEAGRCWTARPETLEPRPLVLAETDTPFST